MGSGRNRACGASVLDARSEGARLGGVAPQAAAQSVAGAGEPAQHRAEGAHPARDIAAEPLEAGDRGELGGDQPDHQPDPEAADAAEDETDETVSDRTHCFLPSL